MVETERAESEMQGVGDWAKLLKLLMEERKLRAEAEQRQADREQIERETEQKRREEEERRRSEQTSLLNDHGR